MPAPQLWIIAYDIQDDKRRRRLAKVLEGYGQRMQWSVFECRLQQDELHRLVIRLERIVKATEDRIRLWPVPEGSARRVIQLGLAAPPPPEADVVV